MIVGYFDESGNDGDSRVFAMAGFLASQFLWFHFEAEWIRILEEFGAASFRASEFYGAGGRFTGWSRQRRSDLEEQLIELVLKYELKHTAVAVPKR